MMLGHDILTSARTQDIKISDDISFDSMLLSPNTLRGLKTSGFYVPSPIQLHGIPLGKCGFDLLLEAKSGTGKTAVFSIIALEKLNLDKGVQTLVLAPTREIASQICNVIKTIGACFKGLSVEVFMGGLPFKEDVEKLTKKVHVIVGSPGRLHYLIRGKHIDVSSVRLIVLDEADKLVEKSFLPDINYIFSLLPNQRQVIMSSATYSEKVKTIMKNYVQNAHHICPDSSSILLGIEQNVILVKSHVNIVKQTKNRYEELKQILSKKQFKQCLIFCNYQVRVGELHRMLNNDKWPADKLYGKQEQTDRLEALKILQSYQCRILITTDLAARGIDASNVDLVINFEIPHDWQTYLHRIGRAGRFGSYGNAITILCEGDEEKKFINLLGSTNIPFDLKYLWSKEPFLLHSPKKDKEIHHDEVNKPNLEIIEPEKIKEPERKLGINETYEELWKMLSVDSIETIKEIHDIPTFESLCDSFEHANNHSESEGIETFSDLLSSFQNHEIKSNETYQYKTLEVNELIIPCTIFNRNVILQSFQKDRGLSLAGESQNYNKPCDKVSGSKLVQVEIDLKDHKKTCNSQSSKTNHCTVTMNDGSKSGTREEYDHNETSEDSDRELVCNNNNIKNVNRELWKSKHNCDASGSKDHQFKKIDDKTELSITSGSSNYETSTDSKKNREASSLKMVSSNNHSKRLIEKVQTLSNVRKSEESYKDSGYNDNAIYTSDCQSEYSKDQKSLLAANLPTAFGKSKQTNSMKSNKHNVRFGNKHFSSHIQTRNGEYQSQLCKNRTELNPHVYESSDDENEHVPVPFRSAKGKKSFIDLSPHYKARKHVSNSHGANDHYNGYSCSNNEIAEKQRQFNVWYQQLQAHMQMIEQSVYIDEMSSSYY